MKTEETSKTELLEETPRKRQPMTGVEFDAIRAQGAQERSSLITAETTDVEIANLARRVGYNTATPAALWEKVMRLERRIAALESRRG